ncbi:sulfatase-like hydrolase/transferase [Tessaracoccus oleiagri]|uniref:Arylsulfatase A n=1 Tax=Tessaracoccus oleiagri TaxID=686624 RepID=A0A1G9N1T6_9ACTN|nr:sulfatase-like hydrolase/transferase [Tessaracoccus oleiagri]SDL80353.1 Arylsulfatase A [Tessaracoccus oleiagri]
MSKSTRPRNVLVIMTDQHRIDTIAALMGEGARGVHTPNIDRLAQEGFAFTQAVTPTPICTPARTSLLTGAAPFRHKVLANHEWNIGYNTELDPSSWTYTKALREAGYNVGLVGKYHVGKQNPPDVFGMDDDSFPGATNPLGHPGYAAWLEEKGLPPAIYVDEVRGTLPGGRPGHLLAARLQQPLEGTFERFLTELGLRRLREYAEALDTEGRPFCLHVHYFGPHLPYIIPDEWFDLIDPEDVELPPSFAESFEGKPQVQRNYATYWSTDSFDRDEWRKLVAVYRGYVAMIDHEVGILLQELETLGIAEETAVFFTADHGEFTGAHRLNDKGPAAYDDILRVPLLAHIPGVGHEGQSDAFVSLLDIPATILDLAGLDTTPVLDGRSLLDLADQQPHAEAWREDIVCEFHGHHFPLQQRTLVTRDYKLVVSPESINELYDRRADPYELVNVYEVPLYRDVRERLAKRLHGLLTERGDKAFANWMLATTPFDVPMRDLSRADHGTARSDGELLSEKG